MWMCLYFQLVLIHKKFKICNLHLNINYQLLTQFCIKMKKFTSVNDIEYRIMKRNSTDTKGSVDASKSHSSVLQVSADRPILELDQRWMELKFIGKKIPARSHHIAVLYKDWLYVHGGGNPDIGTLGDFHRVSLVSKQLVWETLQTQVPNYPGPLRCHTAVVHNNTMLIFGGQLTAAQNNNKTFVFNFETKHWSTIQGNEEVPKLDSHSSIMHESSMYVFGGYIPDTAEFNSAVCKLDLQKSTWRIYHQDSETKINKGVRKYPEPRINCSVAEINGYAWLFGGHNGIQSLNDMWRFNFNDLSWLKIVTPNPPVPRKSCSMVSYRNCLVIFGGIQQITKQLNDVYLYQSDCNNWIKVHTNTNSIYDSSPTLKNKRAKHSKTDLGQSKIYQTHSPSRKLSSIMEENKLRKFQTRKKQLLKDFQTSQKKRQPSPTTQNLIKTLNSIGNQQSSHIVVGHEILYDESKRFIIGKKPCSRDGHTGLAYGDKLLVFGGDRHQMCFSDAYYFDLAEVLKNKSKYDGK